MGSTGAKMTQGHSSGPATEMKGRDLWGETPHRLQEPRMQGEQSRHTGNCPPLWNRSPVPPSPATWSVKALSGPHAPGSRGEC